ncbi:MAG: hypothetical protein A2070_14585 [Bdellovibrionales bacterium GWC1_52_8]|nr:MAG: hypothetical protein A2Z97_12640 [Bdellovibrionales bacterium GWB1_52_6]OFZ04169.1 MAG: hypothetical protein A2X97_15340 [Bdellovibrionales bacterium GWA1_52_35]OFZ33279.1 MAG: hypothetical protein A2070_14585 [Bdellovibrionales bacterium GWC1_52_8]
MNGTITAFLISLSLLGSLSAQADERFISDNFARNLRGGQAIDVMRDLRIGGGRMRINSVFVVASTERGRGTLELVANGRTVFSKQIGVFFESVQIPVNSFVGRELRSLQVVFRGDFNLAMLGASTEDDFGGPGGGYPGGGGNGGGHGGPGGGHPGGGFPPPRR